jgi:putative endopeptidase
LLIGKAAPVIDGYTGDQRFFPGFGQIYRNEYRETNLQQRLPPAERVKVR